MYLPNSYLDLRTAEIFLVLQTPRGNWQRLAKYLRTQIDLVGARESPTEPLAMEAMVRARNELWQDRSLERHELKLFWGTDF
jgi:hypothetical protein